VGSILDGNEVDDDVELTIASARDVWCSVALALPTRLPHERKATTVKAGAARPGRALHARLR
jgi:hypothetical protein